MLTVLSADPVVTASFSHLFFSQLFDISGFSMAD